MKSKNMPKEYQNISPAGAEVKELMENEYMSLAYLTMKAGKVSKAVTHKTVLEIWYILSGTGEIWWKSKNEEKIINLEPGMSIDIPLGVEFQYRSANSNDLVFLCMTTPPWPGHHEVKYLENGVWPVTN